MVSPDPESAARLAERVYRNATQAIIDRDTFDDAFDRYLGKSKMTTEQDTVLRDETFKQLTAAHEGVSEERIFSKAGGRNLAKDKKTRAKRTTRDIKEYKRMGAQKSDLEGYDTPPKREYTTTDYKGLKARKVTIKRKGKTVRVWRDTKGRFTKVIRE